jgi:hypothetical protein
MFAEIAVEAFKKRVLEELARALAESRGGDERGLLKAIEIVKNEPTD